MSGAERQHQAEEEDDGAGAEGPHLDQVAARDHQPAENHQRRRQRVGGRADEVVEPRLGPAADVAAVPAGPEHRAEERPDREQAEADQLGMLVPTRRFAVALRPLLHALGHARPERASLPTARHARLLRRQPELPSTDAVS